MSAELWLFLLAGFIGGAVNAAAGGAKLFIFPMLLASGLPPVVANATSTVALWPAQIPAAWVYRRELLDDVKGLLQRLLPALCGALLGALTLVFSSEQDFVAVIPLLLLIAVGAILLGPRATQRLHRAIPSQQLPLLTHALFFVTGFYGAYFGAGLGFMLLAILSLSGMTDIQRANATKLVFAFCINTTAVIPFALSGIVNWVSALFVLIGGLAGGYLGARITRHLPAWLLRSVVVATGLMLTGHYLLRQ
jgi:uncharacterized membrane protein YfcA